MYCFKQVLDIHWPAFQQGRTLLFCGTSTAAVQLKGPWHYYMGSWFSDGAQDVSLSNLISCSSAELAVLTITMQGELAKMVHLSDALQCCFNYPVFKFLAPVVSGDKCGASEPTSCGTFTEEERLTQLAMSSRSPIFVQQKCCFIKPKHQLGANFVCLTGRNEIFTSSCKPVRTCHIKQYIINRFLFWPAQLSVCRCTEVSPIPCALKK